MPVPKTLDVLEFTPENIPVLKELIDTLYKQVAELTNIGIVAVGLWDEDIDTGIYIEKTTDEDYLRFWTAGAERMTISNVGVVDIAGGLTLDSLNVNSGTLVANLSGYANKVGIGTATPGYMLDILATSNQLRISYDSDDYVTCTVDEYGVFTIYAPYGDINITSAGMEGSSINLRCDQVLNFKLAAGLTQLAFSSSDDEEVTIGNAEGRMTLVPKSGTKAYVGTTTASRDFEVYGTITCTDAIASTNAVTLGQLLTYINVSLNYWLGNTTLDLILTDSEAALTELVNDDPDTLSNIYFKSSVADTDTPFIIRTGTIITIHFDADETSGAGRNVGLTFQLGYVDSDGTTDFQQIGTDSNSTTELTTTKTSYTQHIHVTSDTTVPSGKRLWLKVIATTLSGAGGYPEVNVYYNKESHHINFGLGGEVLENFMRVDGTTPLTGDWNVGAFDITVVDLVATNFIIGGNTLNTDEWAVLDGIVSNDVIDHTSVNIDTTAPLAGGGDISSTRTLTIGGLSTIGTSNHVVGVNNAGNAWEYKDVVGTANEIEIAHTANQIQIGIVTSPTLDGNNFTGMDADDVDIADAGTIITATEVEGALQENRTAIDLNTLKDTNVSTTLEAGTVNATTYGITSDGGVDDIVLPEADTDNAGLLGADKWDEIVANSVHSADNSQAHSDYLINNGNDTTTGSLTIAHTTPPDLILDNATTGEDANSGWLKLTGNAWFADTDWERGMALRVEFSGGAGTRLLKWYLNNLTSELMSLSSSGSLTLTDQAGGHGGNLTIPGVISIKSNNELRFYDNGNYVGFEAPALSADQIWVLPTEDGDADEVLTTDGSGTLSWAAGGGGNGATPALDNLVSVAINTSLISDTDNTDDLGSATRWKDLYLAGSLKDNTNSVTVANTKAAYDHSQVTHDYAHITGNDGATDVTASELEELTDASDTILHSHSYGFEVDINGDLMPVTDAFTDAYFEVDGNDDIMPKAA